MEELKNQLTLVPEIPMDNPDALKKKKKKEIANCLTDILNEIFFERKLTVSKVVKDTGIPFTTLDDWMNGRTEVQYLDENIAKLARYLNVSIEYMAFGIGEDDPIYKTSGEK